MYFHSPSLHYALPICFVSDRTYADIQLAKDWLKARMEERISRVLFTNEKIPYDNIGIAQIVDPIRSTDRKSTRLNSSHVAISYAVFCVKIYNIHICVT